MLSSYLLFKKDFASWRLLLMMLASSLNAAFIYPTLIYSVSSEIFLMMYVKNKNVTHFEPELNMINIFRNDKFNRCLFLSSESRG